MDQAVHRLLDIPQGVPGTSEWQVNWNGRRSGVSVQLHFNGSIGSR